MKTIYHCFTGPLGAPWNAAVQD